MRLEDAIVLPALTEAREARRRLAALPGRTRVVVRLEWDGETSLYAFRAGEILAALTLDEDTLATALGLLAMHPTRAVELDEGPGDGRGIEVLVHGDEVLGVLVPEGKGPGPTRRGVPSTPAPVEPRPSPQEPRPAPTEPTPASSPPPPAPWTTPPAPGREDRGRGPTRNAPFDRPRRGWRPPQAPGRPAPTRGRPFPLPRLPWRTRSAPPTAPPAPPRRVPPPVPPVWPPPAPRQAPAPRAPAPRPPAPPAPVGLDDTVFTGYPRVGAPDAVVAGSTFDIRVGIEPEGSAGEAPMTITRRQALPDESVRFVVSVMGHGFDFPDGVRAELLLPAGAPEPTPEVVLRAVAQPVTTDVVRVLEVSFECAGDVVGRAWREVRVCAASLPDEPAPMRSGGTGVAPPPGITPHLTVEIRSRQGEPEVEWLIHARDTLVATPEGRVTTMLGEGSAKEFAIQVMNQVPAQQGSPLLRLTMIGIGRRVSAAMPTELWPLLEQTWQAARAAGEVPTLLILTNEPWVPWELAWLDGDYVDPTLLPKPRDPDDDPGACLGALWRVGRWVPPMARTPRGGDRPPSPPTSRIDVGDVAVVVGDYASDVSLRPLPEAEAEGAELVQRYEALALKATEDDMDRLLRNRLTEDGHAVAPNLVHIAAHGEVSPDNQQYSGIILSQTQRRLDPLVVQGSELARETRPFVFLNACQVGTAGAFLSEYGGMPGAFLSEGCRGFVAPLWNVDDSVAHQLALRFYDSTFGRGVPVAESLRQIRQVFGTPWDRGTATPLAYVFYGHPSLVLDRAGDEAPTAEGHDGGSP